MNKADATIVAEDHLAKLDRTCHSIVSAFRWLFFYMGQQAVEVNSEPITTDWLQTLPFHRINDREYTLSFGDNDLLVDFHLGESRVTVTSNSGSPDDGTVPFQNVKTQGQLHQLMAILQP